MRKKSVIFLDFDGVINIDPRSEGVTSSEITTNSKYLKSKQYIHWNPKVITALIDCCNTNGTEIIWVTTWCDHEDIVTASDIMGLPRDLYSVSEPKFTMEKRVSKKEWTRWKRNFIYSNLRDDDRPYVWIDDEAIKHWANDLDWQFRSPYKFLAPKEKHGLTVDNITEITDWITEKVVDLT